MVDDTYLSAEELSQFRDRIPPSVCRKISQTDVQSQSLSLLFPADLDNQQPAKMDTVPQLHLDGVVAVPTRLLLQSEMNPIPCTGIRHVVRQCRLMLDVPMVVKKALRTNELVVKHETVIDTRRKEMLILCTNETLENSAVVGDVTLYKHVDDPLSLRGKLPVAPIQWGHREMKPHDATTLEAMIASSTAYPNPHNHACLFMQYAFFMVKPTLMIPFRSSIEKFALKSYQKNTEEARKLDMQLIQEVIDKGLDKQLVRK
ncbi:uncharacterized protein BYT42DRAFT_544445 [Radiomyces spectabilis]|uniref:uncharacterized protein n=1 Tax=Radiomyces spectabilis TaxID=64574 RepID=UPI00221E53C5|nr:uncharacterized protein BYT42DRAFT_544445 [Radiomyces spectabilis]KAI8384560.1 hypothetical protein BYT42DRAFT_544445 [Radiomyces spectabilis]